MAAKFHGQTCHVNLNDSNSFKEKDKKKKKATVSLFICLIQDSFFWSSDFVP